MTEKELRETVSHFNIESTPIKDISLLGNGLINDTYKVTTRDESASDYVLQRINHAIFQDVDMLQSNIEAVTSHIYKKLKLFHDIENNKEDMKDYINSCLTID